MPFSQKAFGWMWLVVLLLVAMSASGTIADRDLLWWFLGGIVAPAIIWTLVARVRRSNAAMEGDKT